MASRRSQLAQSRPVGSISSEVVLRGELFRAGEGHSSYKLRWFELTSEGTLSWSDSEGSSQRGAADLRGAQVVLGRDDREGDELRFNFGVVPAGGAREYVLQSSSAEERRLWVDAMEGVAHPDVARSSLIEGSGRQITMEKPPPPEPLGIDLGSSPGLPCVTVMGIKSDAARKAGLLTGDVVISLNNTTLRNAVVARRAFAAASGTIVLRLANWNRAVRLHKREGKAGIALAVPATPGPGVIVSGLQAGGAGQSAGLVVGDRLLAINGLMLTSDHERVSEQIRSSGEEVRLVVSGFTLTVEIRKDADGLLGLRFVDGAAPRGLQGAVVAEVRARLPAREAGLRAGDIVVSVDGTLITEGLDATAKVAACGRALSLVVWRAQPDTPAGKARAPPTPVGGGSRDAMEGGGAEWTYSNMDVLGGAPPDQPLYEDFTIAPQAVDTSVSRLPERSSRRYPTGGTQARF